MNSTLKITTEDTDHTTVISLHGDLTLASTVRFRLELLKHAAKKNVTLNLEKLEYTDSSGLAALIEGHQEAKRNEYSLVLKNVQPRILEILKMAQLHTILNIIPE
tara:strand:- start:918 stop:1232 length:315 start_codon:yes stop_codon:yes gene_type:complete